MITKTKVHFTIKQANTLSEGLTKNHKKVIILSEIALSTNHCIAVGAVLWDYG
jgi:hypothetical protein